MADLNAVNATLEALRTLRQRFKTLSDSSCRCEENASDMKGPCHYCTTHNELRNWVAEGERVASIPDPMAFDYEATEFLIRAEKKLAEYRH
jgi:hypothetical protein